MPRTSPIIEQALRRDGYVSASVACAQYGLQRSQLLDLVLQGKVAPQKPDSSAMFYVKWEDLKKVLGTPKEYRARPQNVLPEPLSADELLLDDMIPMGELQDMYRDDAGKRGAIRSTAQATAAAQPARSMVVRPSDYAKKAGE